MTLNETFINEDEKHTKVVITNNIREYVILKKKHIWHNLELSKKMKENINNFLKKDSKDIFLNLQKIAKRQNEIKSYLEKFKKDSKDIFARMYESKYYKEQNENMKVVKKLLKKFNKEGISDFIYSENGLDYIKDEYCIYLLDNKWFEAIGFYLLASLNLKSKLYLDIDIRLGSGEVVQMDIIFISDNCCALVECKSGNTFNSGEIAKMRVYKSDFTADYGLILRCKDNLEYNLREDIVGVFIIDGIFSKGAVKLKKELIKLLSR